jgi:hypothetical protein
MEHCCILLSTQRQQIVVPETSLSTKQLRGAVKKFPESSDLDSLVHHEFVPSGLVISTCKFSRGSCATSCRQGQWFLQHDDKPSYTRLSCHHPTTVLSESRSELLLAVSYSENGPKRTRFATMGDIKSNAEPQEILKEAFHRLFQKWQDPCSKCVCVCARARARACLKVIR